MNVFLDGVKRCLKAFPPIKWFLMRSYDRYFESANDASVNLFRGVFPTYQDAAAHLPNTKPASYDNSASASMYLERTRTVYSTDYPVLYWMSVILEPGFRVFDFGGHIGVSYYSYRRYLSVHDQLRWTVCDLPAVVESGRKLAESRNVHQLDFTTDFQAAAGCDLMLCNGSLQYLQESLGSKLKQLAARPRHLVINMLPVHADKDFYTVQNISTAYCAYHIFSAEAFLNDIQSAGYRVKDSWRNTGKHCAIPFHGDCSVEDYSGYYFELMDS